MRRDPHPRPLDSMRVLTLGLAGTIAGTALGSGDTRAITRWLEPVPGLFSDARRWDAGVPTAETQAIFGVTPGPDEFVVTVPGSTTIGGLAVVSQRPVLLLETGTFTVLETATVAGTPPDVAALVLREPPNGPIALSNVQFDEALIVGGPGASGEVLVEGARLYGQQVSVGVGAGSQGLLRFSAFADNDVGLLDVGTDGGDGRVEAIGPQMTLNFYHTSLGTSVAPAPAGVGTFEVRAGATVTMSGVSFGPPLVAPSGTSRSRVVVRDQGSLLYVNGLIEEPSGTISITVGNGALFRANTLTFGPDSELAIEIGPAGPGRIGGPTPTTLDGSFVARTVDGAQISEGTIYEVISGAWASGSPPSRSNDWFDAITTPVINGEPMVLVLSSNSVLLLDLLESSSLTLAPETCQVPQGFTADVSAVLEFVPGFPISVDRGLTWTSDDPTVAIATTSNVVVGVSPGTTTLRATLGSKTAELLVEVTPFTPSTELLRMSVSSDGVEGNDTSSIASDESFPAVSDDGRYAAFSSYASNLVPDDTNGVSDVFVHDAATGETTRVSVTSAGAEADGASLYPAISGDGRFVTFSSRAAALSGNGSTLERVYVHDRATGTTSPVAVKPDGALSSGSSTYSDITPDGRYVAWVGNTLDVVIPGSAIGVMAFRKDLLTGETVLVSQTFNGTPTTAMDGPIGISDDGAWVAFTSVGDIVADGPPGSFAQAYARSPDTGEAFAASRSPTGAWANATCLTARIDGAGRRVGFLSAATNLLPTSEGARDFFVADRIDDTLRVANSAPDGAEADSTIGSIALSSSGRFATFRSAASNLVPGVGGVEQCFRKDLLTNAVELVSEGPVGPSNKSCAYGSSVSSDGGVVVFGSRGSNLVPLDLNEAVDIFRRTLSPGVVGDLDGDGVVDGADLGILLAAWATTSFDADLDRDGLVGPEDLAILLGAWSAPRGVAE
jgi:hypothetical protein